MFVIFATILSTLLFSFSIRKLYSHYIPSVKKTVTNKQPYKTLTSQKPVIEKSEIEKLVTRNTTKRDSDDLGKTSSASSEIVSKIVHDHEKDHCHDSIDNKKTSPVEKFYNAANDKIIIQAIEQYYSYDDIKHEILMLSDHKKLSLKKFFKHHPKSDYTALRHELHHYVDNYSGLIKMLEQNNDSDSAQKFDKKIKQYLDIGDFDNAYQECERDIHYHQQSIYHQEHQIELAQKYHIQAVISELNFENKQAIDKYITAAKMVEKNTKPSNAHYTQKEYLKNINKAVNMMLKDNDRLENAAGYVKKAYSMIKNTIDINRPEIVQAVENMAKILCYHHIYDQAEKIYQNLYHLICKAHNDTHPKALDVQKKILSVYQKTFDYGRAQETIFDLLEKYKRVFGDNHPETLNIMNSIGTFYKAKGNYEKAAEFYQETLVKRQELFGEQHPLTLNSMNNLAALYQAEKKYEEAEELFIKTLKIRQDLLGENHVSTIISLNNLGYLYEKQGRYQDAERLLLQALRAGNTTLSQDNLDRLTTLNNLAAIYQSQKKYEEAESLYIEVLDVRKKILGDHLDTAAVANNLATIFQIQHRYQEAKKLLHYVTNIARKILPENHNTLNLYNKNLENFNILHQKHQEQENTKDLNPYAY